MKVSNSLAHRSAWRRSVFDGGSRYRWPRFSNIGTLVEQISPDKNVNCRYTTAAFTLSPESVGLHHVVLACPETRPYMLFLFVGS